LILDADQPLQQTRNLSGIGCWTIIRAHSGSRSRLANVPLNVLFLCTGNSARSIMAEAYLNSAGRGQFAANSAGSHPAGAVNPFALELLRKNRIKTDNLRSKNWDELARPGAPKLDFVFTVCDNTAGEVCPIWPGQPMTAHWGIQDPAAVQASDEDKRRAFLRAFTELSTRINLFMSLPLAKLDRLVLKKKLEEIGKVGSEAKL
jgi:arsenate reductase (thioredoxin)